MIANINPETGIAYGYISANCLDGDVVTDLLDNGTEAAAQECFEEWKKEKAAQLMIEDSSIDEEEALSDADGLSYEFWESYERYEPIINGEHEGVKYVSSWLGGALNFFILESSVITNAARLASPCVQNAGILDTLDGSVESYDVPASWRRDPNE